MSFQELFLQAKGAAADLWPPTGIAFALAAFFFLFIWRWLAYRPKSKLIALGGVLAVSVGFFVGCGLFVRPHWPPAEDQDRFILILFPAVVVVELIAAPLQSVWLPWVLRVVLAAMAGRILLHNSSYITDLSGPGTRQWSPEQTWMILGGLAAALASVWVLLTWLSQREPGRAVPLAVAVASAGAAVVIMMSGYASGGPLAMPLVGAVVGALFAELTIKEDIREDIPLNGILGLSVVGLFALLVMGHFFGELTWVNAALLFFAPLVCWLPELAMIPRARPRLRTLAGVVLTIVPVVVAFALAQQKLVEDSTPTSPDSTEPTLEDYMNFGK